MPWDEIAGDPSYQALEPERQARIKTNYFNDRIAPNVPAEQIEGVRTSFLGAPPQPSLIQRAGDAVSGAMPAVREFTGQTLKAMEPVSNPLAPVKPIQEAKEGLQQAIGTQAEELGRQMPQDALGRRLGVGGLTAASLAVGAVPDSLSQASLAESGQAIDAIEQAAVGAVPALGREIPPPQYIYNALKYRLGIPQETGLVTQGPPAQLLAEGKIGLADAMRMDPEIYAREREIRGLQSEPEPMRPTAAGPSEVPLPQTSQEALRRGATVVQSEIRPKPAEAGQLPATTGASPIEAQKVAGSVEPLGDQPQPQIQTQTSTFQPVKRLNVESSDAVSHPWPFAESITEAAKKVNASIGLDAIIAEEKSHGIEPNKPDSYYADRAVSRSYGMIEDETAPMAQQIDKFSPRAARGVYESIMRDIIRIKQTNPNLGISKSVYDALDKFAAKASTPEMTPDEKEYRQAEYNQNMLEMQKSGLFEPRPATKAIWKMKLDRKKWIDAGYGGEIESLKGMPGYWKKGGLGPLDLPSYLRDKGIIPHEDPHMAIDALVHERIHGQPKFRVMAEGAYQEGDYVPPAGPRPGQEGGFNVPRGGKKGKGYGPEIPGLEKPPLAEGQLKDMTPPKERTGEQVLGELENMRNTPEDARTLRQKANDLKDAAERNIFDHTLPIKHLVAEVEAANGKALEPGENAWVMTNLFPGVKGIIEHHSNFIFQPIVDAIQKAGLGDRFDNMLQLTQMLKRFDVLEKRALEQIQSGDPELAAEGTELLGKIRGNMVNARQISRNEALQGLEAVRNQVGENNWNYMQRQADKIYRETRKLLTELRDLGVISKKGFATIESQGIDYVPNEILEKMENPRATTGQKISQQYQDIVKTMKGSTEDVRAALPALYNKQIRMIVAAEKQRIFNVIKGYTNIPDLANTIRVLKPGEKAPHGFEEFAGFANGKVQRLMVPEGAGNVLNGLGKKEISLLGKMLSLTSATFKSGTTHMNLAFIGPHTARFVKDFAMLSPTGLQSVTPKEIMQLSADLLEGLFHVVKQDKVYQDVLRSKALYSTFAEHTSPELFIKGMEQKTREREFFEAITSLVPKIVRTLDNAIKVASYQRGQRIGLAPEMNAVVTRRYGGAPDYAVHGNYMPEINQLLTYANVRAQLSYRQGQAAINDPGRMKWTLALLSTLAAVRYLANHRDAKTSDQYDRLPAYERNRKNIYMIGNDYKTAQGETRPEYVTIPKTEMEAFTSIAVEGVLDAARKVGGRSMVESMINSATSMTPSPLHVDLQRAPAGATFKDKAILTGTQAANSVASELAPILRAPMETLPERGYDAFKQRDMMSDSIAQRQPYARYNPQTTETAKFIGKAMASSTGPGGNLRGGVSPIKVEKFIEDASGGVGRGIMLDTPDAIARRLGVIPDTVQSGYERAARMPGLSRLLGHAPMDTGLKDTVVTAAKESNMDMATAKAKFIEAVTNNVQNPSPQNIKQIQVAARQVGNVDPAKISSVIQSAVHSLSKNGRVHDAFDIFWSLPPKTRAMVLQQWRQTPAGKEMHDALFAELKRRQQTNEPLPGEGE